MAFWGYTISCLCGPFHPSPLHVPSCPVAAAGDCDGALPVPFVEERKLPDSCSSRDKDRLVHLVGAYHSEGSRW